MNVSIRGYQYTPEYFFLIQNGTAVTFLHFQHTLILNFWSDSSLHALPTFCKHRSSQRVPPSPSAQTGHRPFLSFFYFAYFYFFIFVVFCAKDHMR